MNLAIELDFYWSWNYWVCIFVQYTIRWISILFHIYMVASKVFRLFLLDDATLIHHFAGDLGAIKEFFWNINNLIYLINTYMKPHVSIHLFKASKTFDSVQLSLHQICPEECASVFALLQWMLDVVCYSCSYVLCFLCVCYELKVISLPERGNSKKLAPFAQGSIRHVKEMNSKINRSSECLGYYIYNECDAWRTVIVG